MIATAAIVATFVLDALLGEPPARFHPVALFGRLVEPLDRDWQYPHAVGVAIATALPLAAALGLGVVAAVALAIHPLAGAALATLVLFSTTSRRSLLAAATTVIDATTDGHRDATTDDHRDATTDDHRDATAKDLGDDSPGALCEARFASRVLVGRNVSSLSAGHLRSAAVESAAENLADGLVAPLAAFALGALVSLPLAVAAAAFVKAVNTLDSMLGYRDKPHGMASARLDDLVMWLPARASAILVALVARAPATLQRSRRWTDRPSSPNSGWPMATVATLLDVRLEKPGAYDLNPDASLPTVADARRSVRVVGNAGILSFALAGVVSFSFAGVVPLVRAGVVAWF